MDDRRLDADAEGFESHFNDADDDAFPFIQKYYASLTPDLRGDGFFDTRLVNFHHGPNLPEERYYCTSPRSLSHLRDDPRNTPPDHPIRAIAWVLDAAPDDSVVRVFCYSLTDPLAIDLLIHAGASRNVRVILHPNKKSQIAMEEFVDQHGKSAFMENMEIRVPNIIASACESHLVQMHDKSIITDQYAIIGSYNLSSFARVGNWESVCVVDTPGKCRAAFDHIWDDISTRQVEKVYTNLQSIITGPRRTARASAREAETARRQQAAKSRGDQEKSKGH
jgi:hypothetical protein